MQELQGVIDNIVFQSEDNQFSVFRVKTDHEGKVSVVYRGPAPFLGERWSSAAAGANTPSSADSFVLRPARL